MTFTGKEGKPISLETARKWTKNYQEKEQAAHPGEEIIKAHFYGKEHLQALLDESGSMGIRIYYALDDEGAKKLVLVSAKADMDDILPKVEKEIDKDGNIILDLSYICPPYCGSGGL